MAVTWTLLSTTRVNREGNQIELDFTITELGFTPRYNQSDVVIPSGDNDYGPLAGWRANEIQFRQFFRDNLEPVRDEAKLFSGALYSIAESSGTVTVKASLRLMKRAQMSSGTDLRPGGSLPATWIVQLPSGFIFLRNNTLDDDSPQFKFTDGWDGLDLSEAAENVGKLPGWNGAAGAPTLRLQCDSFAERALRFADSPSVNEAIDGWADLRSTSPNNLTQNNTGQQPRIFANAGTPPEVRFTNDILEQTPGYNLNGGACAFGVVFRTNADVDVLSHLIGRWSGEAGVDNVNKWQWRMLYERTSSPSIQRMIKVQIADRAGGEVNTLSAPLPAEPTAKTIAVYRATSGIDAKAEIWINGVLAASISPLPAGGNTVATNKLTVGARYNGAGAVSDALAGAIDQCFVYSSAISDATLCAVHHDSPGGLGSSSGHSPIPTSPSPTAIPIPSRAAVWTAGPSVSSTSSAARSMTTTF